jgi:hypothetical protein
MLGENQKEKVKSLWHLKAPVQIPANDYKEQEVEVFWVSWGRKEWDETHEEMQYVQLRKDQDPLMALIWRRTTESS